MPYIHPNFRKTALTKPIGPGELNYCITQIIIEYVLADGDTRDYTTLNEVVGVLEQVKDEFQRRVVHPYEDRKRAENGDVYPVL